MDEQENTLLLVGYEKALLGIVDTGQPVYCYTKLVRETMKKFSINRIDAIEYIDFNIVGAYIGEFTPIIVYPLNQEDA